MTAAASAGGPTPGTGLRISTHRGVFVKRASPTGGTGRGAQAGSNSASSRQRASSRMFRSVVSCEMKLGSHRQLEQVAAEQPGDEEEDLDVLDVAGLGIEARDDFAVKFLRALLWVGRALVDMEDIRLTVVPKAQLRCHSISPSANRGSASSAIARPCGLKSDPSWRCGRSSGHQSRARRPARQG